MEKISYKRIKDIYINVLKYGFGIKMVNDQIVIYHTLPFDEYHEWTVKDDRWVEHVE